MKKSNYFAKATKFMCRKVRNYEEIEIIGIGSESGMYWVRWIRRNFKMYADPDAIEKCKNGKYWMAGPEALQAADGQVAHNNNFRNNKLIEKSMETHPPENPEGLEAIKKPAKPAKKDPPRPYVPSVQETRERQRQPEPEAEKWEPSYLKSYEQLEAERRALA